MSDTKYDCYKNSVHLDEEGERKGMVSGSAFEGKTRRARKERTYERDQAEIVKDGKYGRAFEKKRCMLLMFKGSETKVSQDQNPSSRTRIRRLTSPPTSSLFPTISNLIFPSIRVLTSASTSSSSHFSLNLSRILSTCSRDPTLSTTSLTPRQPTSDSLSSPPPPATNSSR